MSLPLFYEERISPNDTNYILSEDTAKHCLQVLRMKIGDILQLTNGKGNLAEAVIIMANIKNCKVQIRNTRQVMREGAKVCIAISLLKNANRFEWFLEKATEIGVHEITPLICKRTEKQNFRVERIKKILVSAMLQSGQAWLPEIHAPVNFEQLISSSNFTQKLIAHCEQGEKQFVGEWINNDVQILVGPEGDFTFNEINLALKNNYQPVSLGNTRLRTETAGIVAAILLINRRKKL